jgi:Ca-activated chloride channel family protein
VLPLFIWMYASLQRRRLAADDDGFGMVQSVLRHKTGIRRHIPAIFFLLGLGILIFSLARPHAVANLPRVEGTLILAFDVSGSMAADDLEPTRLEAAKAAARNFVQRQPPSVKIGVVTFSESGFAVQAPTNEQETVIAAIDRLTLQRGTSLAQGIIASLNAIAISLGEDPPLIGDPASTAEAMPTPLPSGEYRSAVIVLLTDGENNAPPDPFAVAEIAADQGVRIHTIGIGSVAGANLDIEGFTVHTQLDEATLQEISRLTDGEYFKAQDEQELQQIYEGIDLQFVTKPERLEVTSVFAGASILTMLIGAMLSLVWFNRLL